MRRVTAIEITRFCLVLAAVAVIARGGDDPAHLGATAQPSTTACIGDCDGDGRVTVAELVRGVRIAIGAAANAECPAIDSSEDGSVTVVELIQAVNRLLNGCQRSCAAEPSNTLVACTDPLSRGLGLAVSAGTVAVAFSDRSAAGEHVYATRLDAALQRADSPPLRISADLAETVPVSHGSPRLTAVGGDFYAVWEGFSVSGTFATTYFFGRTIPTSGAPVGDVDLLYSDTPFGSCGVYAAGPLQATANLAGDGFHTTSRRIAYCIDSILYENINGVPGVFASPPPGNVSSGGAPLATGTSDVAAVWFNVYAPELTAPRELSLKAGWIEPAPSTSVTLTPLDAVARSESPALAASGHVYLAVWTTATAPPPAVPTEVRGVRFTRAGGPLDPSGGFLIATAAGEVLSPAVAGNDAGFVVAWREVTATGTVVRAVRIEASGSSIDATPIDVAASDDEASLAVATSPTADYVAFTRREDNGFVSTRVTALPQP